MKKALGIIHLGPGNVGREFLNQLADILPYLKETYGVEVRVLGVFNASEGLYKSQGLSKKIVQKITFSQGQQDKLFEKYEQKTLKKYIEKSPIPLVLVDTTASEETYGHIYSALKKGHFAVLSNKKPLTLSVGRFKRIYKNHGRHKRFFFETTVGAGLPVINSLKELIETGDEVLEIKGCFSGTLGYIFSQLDKGLLFSSAVKDTKKKGFTEPDPRDDLSGLDVARKALILARVLGINISLEEIVLEGLIPKDLEDKSVEEFLEGINKVDQKYAKWIKRLQKKGEVLRYVAYVSHKGCKVGLSEVSNESDIGLLSGSDNIVIVKTKRYHDNELVIKGPGAGVAVTAAGVIGDLIKVVTSL